MVTDAANQKMSAAPLVDELARMIRMERKTEYVATETHRYTFRCSCGYLSDPLINIHDAQQVLKMHQAHEGTQELTVYAVGQPSYR